MIKIALRIGQPPLSEPTNLLNGCHAVIAMLDGLRKALRRLPVKRERDAIAAGLGARRDKDRGFGNAKMLAQEGDRFGVGEEDGHG